MAVVVVVLALILLLEGVPSRGTSPPAGRVSMREVSLPEGVPLSDALEFLESVSGANFHVEWKLLEAAGVGKDAPVNVRLRSVSLRKALSLVLSEAAGGDLLTFYSDGGVIEVTTREQADKQMFTRVYPIQDLIVEVPDFAGPDLNITSNNPASSSGRGGGGGGGSGIFNGSSGNTNDKDDKSLTRAERADQLIDVITQTIQPDVWQANGGSAAVRFFNGNLIVTAPRSVHEALGGYIE